MKKFESNMLTDSIISPDVLHRSPRKQKCCIIVIFIIFNLMIDHIFLNY